MISIGLRDGCKATSLAAMFVTCGAAIEVPDKAIISPPGTRLSTSTELAYTVTCGPKLPKDTSLPSLPAPPTQRRLGSEKHDGKSRLNEAFRFELPAATTKRISGWEEMASCSRDRFRVKSQEGKELEAF
jgi:hypothetical protein